MNLIINGNDTAYTGLLDIDSLLKTLKIPEDHVAVVLNDDVILRENRKTEKIKAEDYIEILTFTGGG